MTNRYLNITRCLYVRFSDRESRFSSKHFNSDRYNKTRLISAPLTLSNPLSLYSKLDWCLRGRRSWTGAYVDQCRSSVEAGLVPTWASKLDWCLRGPVLEQRTRLLSRATHVTMSGPDTIIRRQVVISLLL